MRGAIEEESAHMVSSETFAAFKQIANTENRPFQAVFDEALQIYIKHKLNNSIKKKPFSLYSEMPTYKVIFRGLYSFLITLYTGFVLSGASPVFFRGLLTTPFPECWWWDLLIIIFWGGAGFLTWKYGCIAACCGKILAKRWKYID